MPATLSRELIDVHALKVGMVVHLDGGWMAHPFPLSRFRIASAEQIATIRAMGLKRVRWEPQFSEKGAADEADADADADAPAPKPRVAAPTAAIAPAALPAPDAAARLAQHPQWARQRAALVLCERQFIEAASACDALTGLVLPQPLDAASQAQALSRALQDKMLGEQDLCIQLLGGTAGDQASAHALNVTILSLLLGRRLGLPAAEMLDLGVGALLHDIGKIALPARARQLEDHLVAEEVGHYRQHVAQGVAQARRMELPPGAALVLAQHHERCDGSGFPLGLGSDQTTLPARIVALVDRYDNLCNPNQAAKAVTPHEALALMYAAEQNRFDAALLGGFIKMMGIYPPGSIVQLSDGRFALVVNGNASQPLKPRLLVFDAAVPRAEALVVDLQNLAEVGIRRSLKPLQLPAPALDYLAPAKRVVYFFEPARAVGEWA